MDIHRMPFLAPFRRILRKTSRCRVGVKRVEKEADSELSVQPHRGGISMDNLKRDDEFCEDFLDTDGYVEDVYDELGFDEDGYDVDGYDEDGYSIHSYDRDGYDRDRVHRDDEPIS